MITELNHVGSFVRDMDKSVDFYTNVLGGQIAREAMIPASQMKVVYIQIHGGLIELLEPGEKNPDQKYGFDHVAFMTDNLDADFKKITDAGYKPLVQPKVAGSGDGRLGFLEDPNGVRIELIERDDNNRLPIKDAGEIQSFDHISLVANDLQGANDFYFNYFNMNQIIDFHLDPPRDLTITYIQYDYDVLEFLTHGKPQSGGDLIGHIALRVANVDDVVAKFKKRGLSFEPGFPKNAGIGGRVAMIAGPDGEKIELLDRKDLREM